MQPTHTANPLSVVARKIVEVTNHTEGPGSARLDFEDGSSVVVHAEVTARQWPQRGDYLVQQDDGYVRIRPKEAFEREYMPIGAGEPSA